ncbi:MAG: AAA family ATPase [Rhodocyclaceae bacterium]
MRLRRIRIEQFRQFRSPLEIDDLAPGLNLITGANEAGKSTVVAAIRAAFFERHRSGSVDDFRPWGDSAAAPTVVLDFELDGQPGRLLKTFLARKRCELSLGREHLDGEEAENRLAELLGYQHAGRGASKAEHWGIPGLLWIQQGEAHALRDAVGHATDHLRNALNQSLGEVAASGGDELLASVEARRNELLTESGGRPRGAYKEALEREAALAAELAALDDAIARYRERVDALARIRREQAADEAEQPWREFRARQQAAVEQLEAIGAVEARLAAARERVAQIDARIALLRGQLDTFARDEQAALARASALQAAEQAAVAASEPVAQWQVRRAQAERALEQARLALREARARDSRAQLVREVEDSRVRLQAVVARLGRAETAQAAVQTLRQRLAASEIRPADLKRLRAQARELEDLRLQQAAVATRVTYILDPGRHVQLDAETLSGSGERRLIAATVLTLPDLGRLEIAPGGADLGDLRARAEAVDARQQTLLDLLGLPDLAAAETRQREYECLAGELAAAQATLAAHAPEGVDALRTEHARLSARADEAAQALARLPAAPVPQTEAPSSGAPLPEATPSAEAEPAEAESGIVASVEAAEAAEQAAVQSLALIQTQLHQAQLQESQTRAALEAAGREAEAARAVVAAADRAERLAQASRALTDARAERTADAAQIDALAAEIAAARPDILRQDVARFRLSADELEKRHAERRDQAMRLEVELQTEGAQGHDERRAELARDHAQAARRATELRRQAQALALLLGLLRDKRRALTRRLQAPLQKHLNHYLQLLFPQASLDIDEDLAPGPLTRPAGAGSETGTFEALSFGAREQMGVISRLAYADLLAEAGRPTLVILDDALVHSDAERLADMKRILFDAATRHQILLFTCHPGNWRDLGVGARALEALKGA